jgi:hypothetical protein
MWISLLNRGQKHKGEIGTATTVLPPKVACGFSGGINTLRRFNSFALHWDPGVTPLRADFLLIAPKNPLIPRDFLYTSIRRRTALKNDKPILRRSHVAQNIGLRWEQLKSGLVQEKDYQGTPKTTKLIC